MESLSFRRGFTLVELVVVTGIITVIMGVVFSSQSTFNKSLILANTAYDIALSLRNAQTYGLGSRATAVGNVKNAGYGLHFQSSPAGSFTFFADTYPAPSTFSVCHPTSDASAPNALPGDCAYNQGQNEQVMSYALGNGITIDNFCAFTNTGGLCQKASGSYGGGLVSLDIVFARPNPDPFMSVNGSYSPGSPVTSACLKLVSPQGGAKFISVASSGGITADAPSCP